VSAGNSEYRTKEKAPVVAGAEENLAHDFHRPTFR
jgi:hypothetical protein